MSATDGYAENVRTLLAALNAAITKVVAIASSRPQVDEELHAAVDALYAHLSALAECVRARSKTLEEVRATTADALNNALQRIQITSDMLGRSEDNHDRALAREIAAAVETATQVSRYFNEALKGLQ